ncbi:hypothetical protein FB446DRAFT_712817 [Lentinula raphanica]|nr:hypothetical protein FB446DRAFT_712817 [Lentinula raphanica]
MYGPNSFKESPLAICLYSLPLNSYLHPKICWSNLSENLLNHPESTLPVILTICPRNPRFAGQIQESVAFSESIMFLFRVFTCQNPSMFLLSMIVVSTAVPVPLSSQVPVMKQFFLETLRQDPRSLKPDGTLQASQLRHVHYQEPIHSDEVWTWAVFPLGSRSADDGYRTKYLKETDQWQIETRRKDRPADVSVTGVKIRPVLDCPPYVVGTVMMSQSTKDDFTREVKIRVTAKGYDKLPNTLFQYYSLLIAGDVLTEFSKDPNRNVREFHFFFELWKTEYLDKMLEMWGSGAGFKIEEQSPWQKEYRRVMEIREREKKAEAEKKGMAKGQSSLDQHEQELVTAQAASEKAM